MKKKIFCFDVDNTICITKGKQYSRSKPIEEVIILINKLYSEGHVIKIFTSRYMGRNNDDINKAYKQGYQFTYKQLKSRGSPFSKNNKVYLDCHGLDTVATLTLNNVPIGQSENMFRRYKFEDINL